MSDDDLKVLHEIFSDFADRWDDSGPSSPSEYAIPDSCWLLKDEDAKTRIASWVASLGRQKEKSCE